MQSGMGLETDYLVVGAGAVGMAFVDTLLDHSDADVVMIDRRHRPGGHWLDSYPFVQLHQPSTNYGVNSTNMLKDAPGNDRKLPTLEAPADPAGLFAQSPFARCLGIRDGEDRSLVMPFSPKIIGNPLLPAIHGGMTGAFLETAAIVGVMRELDITALPKPIF